MNKNEKIIITFLTIMGLGIMIFGISNIIINEKKVIDTKHTFIKNNNSIGIYNIITYPENELYYNNLTTLEKINYNNYQIKELQHINEQTVFLIFIGLGALILMSQSVIKPTRKKIKKKKRRN